MLDAIVIGGGINGSWTALHLARRGQNVTLLDQFPLPHSRGSSHGQSRGIRKAYPEPFLTQMMHDAYEQWHNLEEENGIQLMKQTGLLTLGEIDESYFSKVLQSFRQNPDVEYELYSPDQMSKKFPNLTMGPTIWGMYDPIAGLIMADKALKTLWDNIQQRGGKIMDNCPVKKIVPQQNSVKVVLQNGVELIAKSLVVCAGAWTNPILGPLNWKLPLEVIKIPVFYWKSDGHIPHNFYHQNANIRVWGTAQLEYEGMNKICLDTGPSIDPERRDMVDISSEKQQLKDFISSCFPNVESTPAIEESCIFTVSPDLVHILDRHPRHSNIIVGCGFSGAGFKLGPVTGEILANMLMNQKQKFDISHFSASRFATSRMSQL